MPIYVYRCEKCGHEFELKQPFGAKPPKKCPTKGCRGKVKRVFTPPAIIFKGPGFHVTDYGRGTGNGKRGGDGKPSADKEKVSATGESSSNSSSED